MPVFLPTLKVLAICNPLRRSPWDGVSVTKKMVLKCLDNRRLHSMPVAHEASAEMHAQRIAFLVEHGWTDPIEIDVGVPSMGCHVDWPVLDGNHRLAAASLRGDLEILAMVGGDLDYALARFGVCP